MLHVLLVRAHAIIGGTTKPIDRLSPSVASLLGKRTLMPEVDDRGPGLWFEKLHSMSGGPALQTSCDYFHSVSQVRTNSDRS